MKHPFRPVSFWQSALMILPDNAFFDLLRSILGSVKTPYNKQNLIEELSRFIARPEIQETMAAYIDNNDRKIIAAIALLSEPVPGELESFFTGEYSYTELQSMLLNLEERLIIYRFRDNNNLRIALNPRLENILAPHAANTGILFPALPINDAEISAPSSASGAESAVHDAQVTSGTLNGRTLAALFAYLLNSDVQVKDDGSGKGMAFVFRKRAVEQGKTLFPGMDINAAIGGLIILGLLIRDGEDRSSASIAPDEAKIAEFKTLSDQERSEYLAGGISLFLHRGDIPSSFQYRNLLKNTVCLIHALCSIAKEGNDFSEATMIKLAELFRRQEEANWSSADAVPPAVVLLQSLVMVGVFAVTTIGGVICYKPVNSPIPSDSSTAKDHPPIAMDSGFSCVLYPEISFAEALDLAAFSTVEETGTTVRFTLSRDSAVGGFNRGYTAEFLWELLSRLSGGRTPDALKWNLDDWEKRWQEVSLNQGVILTLGGERGYLAGTEPLASMIKQSLAPGVFLLSASVEEAAAALRDAGVDIIARPEIKKKSSALFFTPLRKPETISLPERSLDAPPAETATAVEQLKERFRLTLAKMKLTKQEQEELESRIERRVVVNETQLKDVSLRYEKLEARSLDYVGKTGIVRQAISTGSLLELSCLNGEKILGIPENLDKKGNEMIITIRHREGGEPIKLALGKISLVRRIKQSIFGV